MIDISEKNFETTIEQALLAGGPDAAQDFLDFVINYDIKYRMGQKDEGEEEETSVERNRFVTALADAVLVAYAEPGGMMEHLCREVVAWDKPFYTLADDANAHLVALGAKPVQPNDTAEWLQIWQGTTGGRRLSARSGLLRRARTFRDL